MIEYSSGSSRLSAAQEDYLKALYLLRRPNQPVTAAQVAQRLGISAPSVSQMLARLSALGLVRQDRSSGQRLTARGERIAVELVRHHRLIEMFLVQVLGYSWDEVHEEAERLEHAISERMEDKIFELLGRPELDPHGDAIPSLDGVIRPVSDRALVDAARGERLRVARVSDEDPLKLRALRELGVVIGLPLEVLEESRFEGPIEVASGARVLSIPLGLARAVFVERADGG